MTSTNFKSPSKFMAPTTRRVRLSDFDWRLFLLLLPVLSLLLLVSLSTTTTTTNLNPLSYLPTPLKSLINYAPPSPHRPRPFINTKRKLELDRSRIAICLVGGARRFELNGQSILENILKIYPNADLFLHSPLDSDAYKLSLLKAAPKIAVVRVFKPKPIPETELHLRVLDAASSPNGVQGLLQYFNLVEGCVSMINFYQEWHNFTYDWIVRTRVDGYWSDPLDPDLFVPGHYIVPSGSNYDGLNDRFGLGDLNSSIVGLSRLSLLPKLDSAGFQRLNSERAFQGQLTTSGVPYISKRIPFCVMSDRKYWHPPGPWGQPVAAISSPGPLSGTKCRPCSQPCKGACVEELMKETRPNFGWTDWANGTLELCDAREEFENGWEKSFDETAGEASAAARKRVSDLKLEQCVSDFKEMKRRTYVWDAPSPAKICRRGLSSR